jgi:hypothetical protein
MPMMQCGLVFTGNGQATQLLSATGDFELALFSNQTEALKCDEFSQMWDKPQYVGYYYLPDPGITSTSSSCG